MKFRGLEKAVFIQALLLFGIPLAHAEDAKPLPSCAATAKPLARLELIFGLSSKRGPITNAAFARFLEREVSPRFPDGFSSFEGHGQWRGKDGRISKEPSRLLLIWYVPDAASDAKIEAIRTAYKKRFHQESVLRADALSCVSF